ncbi:hypothetical protein F2P81_008869 [Scophthalmus maximus]|uniref:MAGE domain-containing protein n=1 Tax=Scophthalmus maximus TaxID=52904 RepID=A0A6A4T025_SCOMX|nr:hypothetical protein F2P81_008869 [Scophthalmus maximus]
MSSPSMCGVSSQQTLRPFMTGTGPFLTLSNPFRTYSLLFMLEYMAYNYLCSMRRKVLYFNRFSGLTAFNMTFKDGIFKHWGIVLYLEFVRIPHTEPVEHEFHWGQRADVEVSKAKILEFMGQRCFIVEPSTAVTRSLEHIDPFVRDPDGPPKYPQHL